MQPNTEIFIRREYLRVFKEHCFRDVAKPIDIALYISKNTFHLDHFS